MPRKNPQPSPSPSPIHQALWLLKQLHHGGNPEHLVNFRCIHNGAAYLDSTTGRKIHPSEPTMDTFVKIRDLADVWNNSLLNQLNYQNFNTQKPANVYYAINPLRDRGHKKENFAGFVALYLDLDDNLSYSYQQRWSQVYFWTQLGFKPSFVVCSGHGFHVYWLLSRMLSREHGEALLKNMVRLADCRQGGNVFDISRVFRLPGFLNVKKWTENDKPGCAVVAPEHTPETLIDITADRFNPEKFENFPPSAVTDLERYYSEARRLSANDPAQFESKVQQVLAGALQLMHQQEQATATTAGAAIAVQNQTLAQAQNTTLAPFTPKFNTVPPADDIKWGRGESWMKKYCKVGYSGLTQGELDALIQKHNWTDSSASALDFKVLYALARKGYMHDAVREFWLRSDNRLHRPDKEAKNANYFSSSYTEALRLVQAAHEQAANSQRNAPLDKIKINHHQTFFVGPENLDVILTGTLKLNEIYIDEDAPTPNEKELYDVDVSYLDPTAPEGVRTQNLFLPHAAFSKVDEFKKYCSDMFCLLSNNSSHLQHLVRWMRLTYREAKSYTFHSKIVFKDDRYVFPSFSITKDTVIQHESSAVSQKVADRIPLLNSFNLKFSPVEQTVQQLKDHWDQALHIHLPRVVAGTLGFIAAGAVAPIFQQQLCAQFHVPTINIRGPSSSAKTETVSHLCTITGVGHGKNVYSVDSSRFALTEMIAATNYLPIVVDEFKQTETNAKELANIRQLFRRMYSGESIIKGRKDMSVHATTLHGGLIIIGENPVERIGNIAEISRILPINSDGFSPADPGNFARWRILAKVFWYELGPLFYKFVLNQDAAAMYTEHQTLMDQVIGLISNSFAGERYRIAHNLATIWFGCRIFDRFILSLWPEAPTIEAVCNPQESLVNYLCKWSLTSGQTLRTTVLVPQLPAPDAAPGTPPQPPKEIVKVYPNNEFFATLKTYGLMIESHDKIIRELDIADVIYCHEHPTKDLLYIPLQTMVNAVSQFCNIHHKLMPDESRLITMLRYAKINPDDTWLLYYNHVVSVRGRNIRALVMDVRMLRAMGVWPAKALLQQTTPGASSSTPTDHDTLIDLPESEVA